MDLDDLKANGASGTNGVENGHAAPIADEQPAYEGLEKADSLAHQPVAVAA